MAIETTGTPVIMGDNGMAGGMGFWGFLILAMFLFGGSGFGGFGGNGNTNALQADVNRGFDNQNLQAQTRDILGAVTSGTAQTIASSTANATNAINAIKDGNAALIREFGNVETALTALSGKQQECCCEIKQQIMQSEYNNAMRDANTNANFTAQIQSVKDMFAKDKIETLQSQVNNLQLQNALAGVVRYPNGMMYSAGTSPFCNSNGFVA